MIDLVLLALPPLFLPTVGLAHNWNWVGKVIESLWPLLVAAIFRLPSELTGSKWPERAESYLTAGLLGLGLACFHIYYFLQGQMVSPSRNGLESILFQLTMPGLGEEIFYRGLLLAVLDKCLARPWKFFGVNIGWGCLISSGLFVATHVIVFDSDLKFSLCPDPFFYFFVAVIAMSMGYLRYKSDSVVPCIIAHNSVNGLRYII
ncbi:MAG: CPBP family intramembrane metalloprotease [Cyanobacteria bacterium REEB67]|nr:CPBP family intramembrane metalloprotease [Cyanobacteria bacterium REEB67]